MSILALVKAAVLGIVEGVTEFLPVSSTGHLIIADRFLRLSPDAGFVAAFEVVIQAGAILAVVVLYWRALWPWAAAPSQRARVWALWLRVLVAILPAFAAGFLLGDFITGRLFTPLVVAIALVFYGVILIIVEGVLKRGAHPGKATVLDVHDVSLGTAFVIGLFQTLALVPGTSRAAATIIGGMVMGLSRGAAAEFSFFLAIPVMAGASGLTLIKHGLRFGAGEWLLMATGFVVAFLSALVVVRFFVGYLRKHDFVAFGWYRIALGIAVALLLAR